MAFHARQMPNQSNVNLMKGMIGLSHQQIPHMSMTSQDQLRTSLIQDETHVTREGLRQNVLFCNKAICQVQQLKSCLTVNLSQSKNTQYRKSYENKKYKLRS